MQLKVEEKGTIYSPSKLKTLSLSLVLGEPTSTNQLFLQQLHAAEAFHNCLCKLHSGGHFGFQSYEFEVS